MKRQCLLFTLLITSTVYSWDFSEKSIEVGLNFIHGFDNSVEIKEPQMIASGLAIGDINGDGWDDIFVVTGENKDANGNNLNPNKLYIAQGDGTFIDQANSFLLGLNDFQASGPLIVDINNDGFRDLIFGSVGENPTVSTYLNQSNSTFLKINNNFPAVNTFGISAGDTDKDGDLDLFLTHWIMDTQHAFWSNDGEGVFTDITPTMINANSYKFSFTPAFVDINNDNWVDLLLTSDFSSSKYFINNTSGVLLQQDSAHITDQNGMGAAVGDYDNDGDLDWFVTSIYDGDGFDEGNWGITGNRLFNNDGNGGFQDVSIAAHVRKGYWGWGACFADFNNDMYLDIFHVNGFYTLSAGEPDFVDDPSRLFINNKDGTFTEMSSQLNLVDTEMGRAILCYDNDRDGDIDILISNNQGTSKFYQNNLDIDNNYISIKLQQGTANIDAIGAKIQLTVGETTQIRQVTSGANFASSTPTAQHFGLGESSIIDSILITWPDDTTKLLTNVSINQYLIIEKSLTISGQVNDTDTSEAIMDLKINLYSESNNFIQSVITNTSGQYVFDNLIPGEYRITTENENYVNQAYPNFNCGIEICNSSNSSIISLTNTSVGSINFNLLSTTNFYPNFNGLWFNQIQSGHGLQIEIIKVQEKPTIYISWYVHHNGKPIWLTGIGPITKGIGSADLYITNGASFPPDFNSADVTQELWGTLNLQFSGMNNINLEWSSLISGFGSSSLSMTRLSNLSNNNSDNSVLSSCQSGAFFNANQSGHGIMLEVLGDKADRIVLTWFTYTPSNEQFWLIADGLITGNTAELTANYTKNSNFPPNFNSSEVERVEWGTINLSRINNDTLIMSWQPNNSHLEFGANSVEFTRLTHIHGISNFNCVN